MKYLLLIVMFLTTSLSFSQDKQAIKEGYYVGDIKEKGKNFRYVLRFDENGFAHQVGKNGVDMKVKYKQTTSHNQITTLEWINSGGIWTETQMFIITKIKDNKLEVFHMRYVVNKGSEGKSWGYGGKGIFTYLGNLNIKQ